jgi:integral membrane sensor domain MASE1
LPRDDAVEEKAVVASRRWAVLAQAALVAAAYFAAAKLALLLAIPPGYATAIWPGSGIALAALLLGANRLWPGVWVGSFATNLTIEGSIFAAAVIAAGSTFQALVGAELVRRHIGLPCRFGRPADVVKFFGLAALAATIAPTCALLPLGQAHPLPGIELFRNFNTTWRGDATAAHSRRPLVLCWALPSGMRWTRARVAEGIGFALALLAATHVVFSAGSEGTAAYAITFLVVPFIIWAAFRFSQREVTTATAAICAIALWYTLRQARGPFSMVPLNESLLLLLLFVTTLVFTGLVLAALLGQLDKAMEALRDRSRGLELRVSERTRDLEQANRRLQEDIAVRARAERMLADTERRFRLMVDSVVDSPSSCLDARRARRELERRRAAHLGLRAGRDRGPALLAFLSARGPRAQEAALGAGGRRGRGPLRGGRLARAQGRLVLLGQRDHHSGARRHRQASRLRQGGARSHRAQPGRGRADPRQGDRGAGKRGEVAVPRQHVARRLRTPRSTPAYPGACSATTSAAT